jgi:hypothetical protein
MLQNNTSVTAQNLKISQKSELIGNKDVTRLLHNLHNCWSIVTNVTRVKNEIKH